MEKEELKKYGKKVAKGALFLLVAAIAVGRMNSCSKNEGDSQIANIPNSYTLVLNSSDAQRLNQENSLVYEVVRKSPHQVILHAEPKNMLGMKKGYQSTITLVNPSQSVPFVATCEEIEEGVYTSGDMRVTPNGKGGYSFVYLTNNDAECITGVLIPNHTY